MRNKQLCVQESTTCGLAKGRVGISSKFIRNKKAVYALQRLHNDNYGLQDFDLHICFPSYKVELYFIILFLLIMNICLSHFVKSQTHALAILDLKMSFKIKALSKLFYCLIEFLNTGRCSFTFFIFKNSLLVLCFTKSFLLSKVCKFWHFIHRMTVVIDVFHITGHYTLLCMRFKLTFKQNYYFNEILLSVHLYTPQLPHT